MCLGNIYEAFHLEISLSLFCMKINNADPFCNTNFIRAIKVQLFSHFLLFGVSQEHKFIEWKASVPSALKNDALPFPRRQFVCRPNPHLKDCRFFPGLCYALLCDHRKYTYAFYSVFPCKNVDKAFLINLHTCISKVYLFSIHSLISVLI